MKQASHLVLITGATRGLGKLVADKFWSEGNNIIIVARNKEELKKTSKEYAKNAMQEQQIYDFPFDLANIEEISSLTDNIKSKAGNPDIIINNAAIQGPIGPIHKNNWQEWQKCLNVCLLAPVHICREFIPSMIQNKFGRIINISGGGSTGPRPNFSGYATAKCGLLRFSETIAQEVEQYGITINCVAPGAMYSGLTKDIINAGVQYAGNSEIESAMDLLNNNPETGKKAAELIHFLTQNKCCDINGKLISAVWDDWEKLPNYVDLIKNNDIYTLRRILPEDRNIKLK
ncbi:SDR family oxidoreductase [Methanomicrobium antiquum]|uniref:SDR family oxidoreductase n=1 Tax=Methanomicrobium antiquum TaxID=487686 RepID=A0AAF0FQF8_9EURY|nr:SDR family oxidoreductase [Methanomicrobium antiquum]WFN36794.1 SDR family oxidoreductase [Methanomicrobium antiquum]